MNVPDAWTPGDPSTRLADEDDVIHQIAWPLDGDPAQARRDLERLVRLGLPCRVEAGVRRFDLYELFFFMRWAHHRHGDPTWARAMRNTRARASDYLAAQDATSRVELTIEREIELGARVPGSLFAASLVVPGEDLGQRGVALRACASSGECRLSRTRLGFRQVVGSESPRVARFGYAAAMSVGWSGARIEPSRVERFREPEPELLPFLALRDGVVRVTDRIADLARELADGAATPWDAVRAFWRFFFARLEIGRIHPHALSAEDPLGSLVSGGRSDCYYASALLAALCRARGIPARMVSGYFLYRAVMTNHYWAEVHVPPYGWVPCDLWSWILADGDVSDEHSELFLGRVDPRLVLERLPSAGMLSTEMTSEPTYTLQRYPAGGPTTRSVEIAQRTLAENRLVGKERVSLRVL